MPYAVVGAELESFDKDKRLDFSLADFRDKTHSLADYQGKVVLIVNTAWHGAFPSAFLNVVWVAIALAAMMRLRRSRIDPGPPPS